MKRLALFAVVLIGSAILASPAVAGSQATLTITPTAPAVGQTVTFAGCGWTATGANKSGGNNLNEVWIVVNGPTTSQQFFAPVAKNGCFSDSDLIVDEAGLYQVSARENGHQAFGYFVVSSG